MVGQLVKLKVDMLDCKKGDIGVCFYDYNNGSQFIFPNGNYDGFSYEEQKQFLELGDICGKVSSYQFFNVMKVSNDFKTGWFKEAFNQEFKIKKNPLTTIYVVFERDRGTGPLLTKAYLEESKAVKHVSQSSHLYYQEVELEEQKTYLLNTNLINEYQKISMLMDKNPSLYIEKRDAWLEKIRGLQNNTHEWDFKVPVNEVNIKEICKQLIALPKTSATEYITKLKEKAPTVYKRLTSYAHDNKILLWLGLKTV